MQAIRGSLSVVGRLLLSTIFLMSAVGNKIPNFGKVAEYMGSVGIPQPRFMLVGAIAFLLLGSLSVILGFEARLGAGLLFVFLVLATYYFHAFWKLEGQAQQEQMVQFMKNLSMMGAMLFIMANGAGPASIDSRKPARAPAPDA
ncbi:MAG TPA: DoxX family protein [Pirellulales bacterium]|nr:DoxX family protein [Pirellulales bacterium]